MFPAELPREWQDELAARTAARAPICLVDHLLANFSIVTMDQAPYAMAPRRPSPSHFVTRSQIVRARRKPASGEVEEHRVDTEQMIRGTQAARHPVISHLHPKSASGTTRIPRPPDAEEVSIRALPHRSVRRRADAEAIHAETQSKNITSTSLAVTIATPCTTSKEWNILLVKNSLSSTRLRVLSQGLGLAEPEGRKDEDAVLQRTNSGRAYLQRTNSGLSVLAPGLFVRGWRVTELWLGYAPGSNQSDIQIGKEAGRKIRNRIKAALEQSNSIITTPARNHRVKEQSRFEYHLILAVHLWIKKSGREREAEMWDYMSGRKNTGMIIDSSTTSSSRLLPLGKERRLIVALSCPSSR
jgi:hypothetical protein